MHAGPVRLFDAPMASRASDQHKDFSPFTQQPTTRSTFNAISFQQGRTELFEPRPWTHGVRPLQQHERDHQRDHSRLSFDNVTKPNGHCERLSGSIRREYYGKGHPLALIERAIMIIALARAA
jgi:hypothetical protein